MQKTFHNDDNLRAEEFTVENATIMFRNFTGNAGDYNRAGDRNFCLFLDDDTAEFMLKRGWNIKRLKPRPDADEDTLPQAYLEVKVNYETGKPPMIWLVTSRNRTLLNADAVMLLDLAEIVNVDLMVSPYHWEVNGKTGVKAYLRQMFVTIYESELELKYLDVPDSAYGAKAITGE